MFGNLLRVLIFIDRYSRVDIPVVIASVIIYHKHKLGEESMAVKTKKIELNDGREGRGVKLTSKNLNSVAKWIDADGLSAKATGESRLGLLAGPNHKQPRVAGIDDIVVKIGKGKDAYYIVIKADQFVDLVRI